ncbi:MAG: hypothetical protein HeimC3_47250 [Candidatus Heimdallarchaeota archaeon LC_3]|nr:MAG: hypothetical protein HeimC3_47250 [Candidatus Heimdallarchaeota archaeon LC_3]
MNATEVTPQIIQLEEEIVEEIKMGYFKCRQFFEKYTNEEIDSYFEKKKEFLIDLCQGFYQKFSGYENVFSGPKALEYINKYQFVVIYYRNGALNYPRSFSVFIDRIKDFNNIPKETPDMFDIDRYITNYQSSRGLDQFLHGFFKKLRRIDIPLREREVQVLKLISDLNFLGFKSDGTHRIFSPTDLEILQALQWTKRQSTTVSRAVNFLYNYKICKFSSIIMNTSKLGFYYALYDDYNAGLELNPNEKFWEIPFAHHTSKIACMPFSTVIDRLKDVNYIPLTHWYWNVNLSKFHEEKKSGWSTFENPDFFAESLKSFNYKKWILNQPLSYDLEDHQIEIAKKLSKFNLLSPETLNDFSPENDTKYVYGFLEKLARQEVFQYYPNINFVGTDYKIQFRFDIKDSKLFEKVLQGLLTFPVVQIFVNEQLGAALGYIKMPRPVVSRFFDFQDDFVDEYPEHTFSISTASKVFLSRSHDISDINFSIKDGTAYLN